MKKTAILWGALVCAMTLLPAQSQENRDNSQNRDNPQNRNQGPPRDRGPARPDEQRRGQGMGQDNDRLRQELHQLKHQKLEQKVARLREQVQGHRGLGNGPQRPNPPAGGQPPRMRQNAPGGDQQMQMNGPGGRQMRMSGPGQPGRRQVERDVVIRRGPGQGEGPGPRMERREPGRGPEQGQSRPPDGPRGEGRPNNEGSFAPPEQRLRHLRIAIENLRAAGMNEPAEQLSRQAENLEKNLRDRSERPNPNNPGQP